MKENILKNNLPLITIIIGIYNGEKYIRECIESVVLQDYKNLEIILIDDGSKDASGKIADEYMKKDNRIKVIHQVNSGVSISRNNALKIARGEYICILDQDDIISRDYVSYFYNLIVENNAEIALTRDADKFLKEIKEKDIEDFVEIWSSEKACKEMLYHKIIIAPWNKMIKKEIIEKNNIQFNVNFFNGEGFAFSIECYQAANKIAVGKRKVYHYRVGNPESGASKFKIDWINSSINAQQYIKSILVNPSKELLKAWEFSDWHTHCDALNLMVGCGVINQYEADYRKIKKKCQKEGLKALNAPVSIQQKIRGILFMINPYIASKIINKFRLRKFKKV